MSTRRAVILGRSGNWTPRSLGSALVAWWHAEDLSDGAVVTWTDRINSLAPTMATGTNQAVKAAASFNSAYPGVTFDGVNDHYQSTTLTGLPTSSTPGEIWVIAQAVTSGAATAAFSYGDTGPNGRQCRKTATTDRPNAGNGTSSSISADGSFAVAGVFGGWFEGTNIGGSWNGVDFTTATGAASLSTTATRVRIGANPNSTAGSFWGGVINQIFVTTLLQPADRERMQGWAAWNQGFLTSLPGGHRYRQGRP